MSGELMSGELMSGGRMSGGRLSDGLKSYGPGCALFIVKYLRRLFVRVVYTSDGGCLYWQVFRCPRNQRCVIRKRWCLLPPCSAYPTCVPR